MKIPAAGILVTGGTGYLGSNIVKKLALKFGEDIKIGVCKRQTSATDRLRNCENVIYFSPDEVVKESFFVKNKFFAVIHCATNYGRNREEPLDILESNLIFPVALLHAAQIGGVRVFINIDTMLAPTVSHYSLSKSQFREWLFLAKFSIRIKNVRLEHFYGPGDSGSKFINYVVRELLRGAPKLPLTLGEQKRDFIFIDDAVDAILLILDDSIESKLVPGPEIQEYEVGTGKPASIREVVLRVRKIIGNYSTELQFGAINYRIDEPMDVKVDLSALAKLRWVPKYDLDAGLRKMIFEERK
jgi:CDP-paratose synthetase